MREHLAASAAVTAHDQPLAWKHEAEPVRRAPSGHCLPHTRPASKPHLSMHSPCLPSEQGTTAADDHPPACALSRCTVHHAPRTPKPPLDVRALLDLPASLACLRTRHACCPHKLSCPCEPPPGRTTTQPTGTTAPHAWARKLLPGGATPASAPTAKCVVLRACAYPPQTPDALMLSRRRAASRPRRASRRSPFSSLFAPVSQGHVGLLTGGPICQLTIQ